MRVGFDIHPEHLYVLSTICTLYVCRVQVDLASDTRKEVCWLNYVWGAVTFMESTRPTFQAATSLEFGTGLEEAGTRRGTLLVVTPLCA